MGKDQLRAYIKANLSEVKTLIISSGDAKIIEFLELGEATASEVAAVFCCSLQSASTRLKKLFNIGYLGRTSTIQDSGGVEYRYYVKGKK